MNYLISDQFLKLIEDAFKTNSSKDKDKALDAISQTREIGKLQSSLNPLEIGKLWEQECPSIINFANTLQQRIKNHATDSK